MMPLDVVETSGTAGRGSRELRYGLMSSFSMPILVSSSVFPLRAAPISTTGCPVMNTPRSTIPQNPRRSFVNHEWLLKCPTSNLDRCVCWLFALLCAREMFSSSLPKGTHLPPSIGARLSSFSFGLYRRYIPPWATMPITMSGRAIIKS